MIKIYLDTNFLLIPTQFKVDIFEEIKRIADFQYEVCVLQGTVDELKRIIDTQKGKNKAAATLALQLLKQKSLYITAFSKQARVDDNLLEISDDKTIVATQDKELKKRVKKKGGKVLILRNKKYLEII